MYTIGQMSEMTGLPASTLRYYDRQGLFPNLERHSGIRHFSDEEVEALRIIECLKASGLEIAQIKGYFDLCAQGSPTYPERKALFEERRETVQRELERLQQALALLNYKCWYYDKAMADGNEEGIAEMLPDSLPPKIQRYYDASHSRQERP